MNIVKLINICLYFIFLNIIIPISTKYSFLRKAKISRKIRNLESKTFRTNIYISEKEKYYYVKLFLGKDSINQTYIVDTTFPLISSPCNICNSSEKHSFPFLNIDKQNDIINCNSQQCLSIIGPNSCKDEKCYFSIDDKLNNNKNIEGFLFNSKIFIKNINSYNNNENQLSFLTTTPIGCTTKEGNFYKNKEINGILGINNNNNTFIDNIYNLGIIQKNIFTICLSKKGGYLSLGEIINNSFDNNNINYINIHSSKNNLFELKVNYIQINEQEIKKEYISYIDSSSKFTYFPKNIFDEIIKIFLNEINKKENKTNLFIKDYEYGYCRIFNNKEEKEDIIFKTYPNIVINFGNFNYEWKPQNYINEYKINNQNKIKTCFGFKESEDNNINIILGINFMIDHEIIFDKFNQKIAIINSDCNNVEFIDDKKDELKLKEDNIKNNNNNFTDIITILNESNIIKNKEDKDNMTNKIYIESLNNKSDLAKNVNNNISIIDNINIISNNSIIESYIEKKNEKINYIKNISSSIIIKNNLLITDIITTHKVNEDENKSLYKTKINTTYINKENNKDNKLKNEVKSSNVNNDNSYYNNLKNNKNDNDKYKRGENAYLKDKSIVNTIFRMTKSFIRNKLIYFLLALILIICGFIIIALISFAIISCFKKIKNRNYIEQIDVEVIKDSKYNSASISSRSN